MRCHKNGWEFMLYAKRDHKKYFVYVECWQGMSQESWKQTHKETEIHAIPHGERASLVASIIVNLWAKARPVRRK